MIKPKSDLKIQNNIQFFFKLILNSFLNLYLFYGIKNANFNLKHEKFVFIKSI